MSEQTQWFAAGVTGKGMPIFLPITNRPTREHALADARAYLADERHWQNESPGFRKGLSELQGLNAFDLQQERAELFDTVKTWLHSHSASAGNAEIRATSLLSQAEQTSLLNTTLPAGMVEDLKALASTGIGMAMGHADPDRINKLFSKFAAGMTGQAQKEPDLPEPVFVITVANLTEQKIILVAATRGSYQKAMALGRDILAEPLDPDLKGATLVDAFDLRWQQERFEANVRDWLVGNDVDLDEALAYAHSYTNMIGEKREMIFADLAECKEKNTNQKGE